jgi:ribosomal protein L40E
MNEKPNAKGLLGKKIGPLTLTQILAMTITFVLCFALTIYGWSVTFIGLLLLPIILYMIPHFVGVKSVKIKAVFGVVFLIVTLAAGIFIVSPGVIDSHSGNPSDNSYFSDTSYSSDDGTVTIETTVTDSEGSNVVFQYDSVSGVGFTTGMIYGSTEGYVILTSSDGTVYTGSVKLGSSTLYIGTLALSSSNDDNGDPEIDSDTCTDSVFLTGIFDGSELSISAVGFSVAMLYIMLIFFLILSLSALMRNKLEDTRKKMESDGRLYPNGYGRCAKCGSLVLPGEVNCRKCGAYIDRPEEMKPKKKDFFECSECGAEVPADATACPKCGAKFDEEDETIIEHPAEKTNITPEVLKCSECGEAVSSTADFCPKCGKKIEKN